MMDRIKIIKIPDGEAPESVRAQWVGLELPSLGKVTGKTDGIISRRNPKLQTYWGVSQGTALNILEQKSPTAARWFRDRGLPEPGRLFTFQDCEVKVLDN